jgi:hypothetical protein
MATLHATPRLGACSAPRRAAARRAARCAASAAGPPPQHAPHAPPPAALPRRAALAAAAATALVLPAAPRRATAADDAGDAPEQWSRYTRAFRERFETSISSATRAYTFEYPASWTPGAPAHAAQACGAARLIC